MVFSGRMRGYFIKLGIGKSVAVITIISIAFSLVVTFIAMSIVGMYYARSFILATVVPALVGPFMSYIFVKIIFELNDLQDGLRKLATTDDLTGVFNRRHFTRVADNEIARAHRFGKTFSAIILDVDDFKRVNDQNGHSAGDAVLKSVATTCDRLCRRIDTFARYGGDEFLFLLPECSLTEAVAFAERIRAAVQELRIEHDGQVVRVTASLGVQAFAGGNESVETLLARADHAMYMAKEAGKNQVSTAMLPQK